MEEITQNKNTVLTENPVSAPHPWRRYFARTVDLSLCQLIWTAVLSLVFHVNTTERSFPFALADAFIALGILFLTEPLLLHFFCTTPGKLLFGIRIHGESGQRPSLKDAFSRTGFLIRYGLGYGIPFYDLYRMYKCYRLYQDGRMLPWEDKLTLSFCNTSSWRFALLLPAYILIIGADVFCGMVARRPPCRGELTVEEFAKNYNHMVDFYLGGDSDKLLPDGSWAPESSDQVYEIDLLELPVPVFSFETQGEAITAITLHTKTQNPGELLWNYNTPILLTGLSFIGAQEEERLFSDFPAEFSRFLQENSFQSFTYEKNGIRMECSYSYEGYERTESGHLISREGEARSFSLTLRLTKIS